MGKVKMEKLYDNSPIYNESMQVVDESYIGYGKNDLSEMDKKGLLKELQRTEKEINQIQSELDSVNNRFPVFTMKERLEDALYYKDKVLAALDEYKDDSKKEDKSKKKSDDEEEVEESPNINVIDRLINELNSYYEKGIITKEYVDLYTEKLNNKRALYEENVRNEELALKNKEEAINKSHFSRFKKKLSEYRKK